MRLLVKLMTINERTDENGSMAWSDTGDRYILRLFRDYVFHQKDEHGRAILDFGHIFDALSKLDVGDLETIPLCSPDGKTLLVCSYADIKQCLENTYAELFPQASAMYPQVQPAMNYSNYLMMNNTSAMGVGGVGMGVGMGMGGNVSQPMDFIPSFSAIGMDPRGFTPNIPQQSMNRQPWM